MIKAGVYQLDEKEENVNLYAYHSEGDELRDSTLEVKSP